MPEFRAVLTPGVITDLETPIQISFTSPRQAQAVVIRLLEMDSWNSLGDTMSEAMQVGSDVIAEFTGAIENYQFQLEDSMAGEAGDDTLVIKIQFAGSDSTIDVPVPDAEFAAEGAEIEIGLEVTGLIDEAEREYTTPGAVFVRHPNLSGETDRPIITFVTGGGDYHEGARRYWRPRSDGLRDDNNLRRIMAYLSNAAHLPDDRLWGQVNIVSHGTEYAWHIRAHPTSPPGQQLSRSDIEALQSDEHLTTPGTDVMDSSTVIVLRGCHLGNNQEILDAVRTLFGGEAKVLAPRYLQNYSWEDDRSREVFRQAFYFWRTELTTPGEDEIYQSLRDQYSEREISNEDLRALVANTEEQRVDDQNVTFEYTHSGEGVPADHEGRMRFLEEEWFPQEANQYTDVTDWGWTSEIVSSDEEETVVLFTGRRRKIEYRRILRDRNGNVVVPDLNNESHYGQSPAT